MLVARNSAVICQLDHTTRDRRRGRYVIYSRTSLSANVRHVQKCFLTSDATLRRMNDLYVDLYTDVQHHETRASIIHGASYKKAFCTHPRAHSRHDQRITLRSSLTSDLSDVSKSSFRHSSESVRRARIYFASVNSTGARLFRRAVFISHSRAVDHDQLKAELNFRRY